MPSNPFEPPRTTDLDGSGVTARGGLFLSPAAMQELVAAAPWVRWLARVTSLSIALGIVKAIKTFRGQEAAEGAAGRMAAAGTAGRLLTLAIVTAVSILFLRVLRRYASASERLRAGVPGSDAQVIAAHASYFKLAGIVIAVVIALIAVLVVLGFVAWVLK